MNGEYPFCETDPTMDELKSVAFEVLRNNPGSEFGDWQGTLIEAHPRVVVDALGNDPSEVYSELADLWESEYDDEASGLCMDFNEWALAFATEEAVSVYNALVEERRGNPQE